MKTTTSSPSSLTSAMCRPLRTRAVAAPFDAASIAVGTFACSGFIGDGIGDDGGVDFLLRIQQEFEQWLDASTKPSIVASNSNRVPSQSRCRCLHTRTVNLPSFSTATSWQA